MGVIDQVKSYLPEGTGFSLSGIFSALTWVVMFIIFCAIAFAIFYYFYRRSQYNIRIVAYGNVGGVWQEKIVDRAIVFKLGGGDTIIHLRKTGKYLPRPRLQSGPSTYWYMIRSDGEWINVSIEDFDEKMRKLNVNYLHEEMRYSRASLQKLLRENYQKRDFWEKYGGVIAYSTLILLTGVSIWFAGDKLLDILGRIDGLFESSVRVMERTENVLVSLDNICSTSGIRSG